VEEINRLDPAEFDRLAAPFESQAAAHAACRAFFEDVMAARQKHRIFNVVLGVGVAAKDEDGATVERIADACIGDLVSAPGLAGHALATFERQIRDMLSRQRMAPPPPQAEEPPPAEAAPAAEEAFDETLRARMLEDRRADGEPPPPPTEDHAQDDLAVPVETPRPEPGTFDWNAGREGRY